ncbi:restriction endonuclease subunit S [Corynebacterium flavescens]|uniref:restriction endonuclease subunit S n=1 Tax=Corynebacterium flavescens TaxID=28028 RepID=UPI001478FD59|nr:restriction endonuclease subunit S [Corynebacterium flavescens]
MTNPQWRNVRLGDIGQSLIGLTYSPSNVKRSGTLVLRSSNIQDGELAFDDNVYVDCAIPEKIRTRENDILICVRNGSRRLIGKSAILDRRVSGQTFGAFMAVYRSDLNPFLRYFFQSDDFKRQIDEHLGATINQITNGSLNGFVVTLPSESEQQAITERLQDGDRLIATLKRLISKKHAIKQGMMQELLTGRTRLPGFKQAWSRATLGRISKVTMGQSPVGSSYNTKGNGLPLIQGNADVSKRATIERVWTSSPTKISEPGNVILTVRAPVGHAAIASHRICLGRGVCGLDAGKDNSFLFHLLVSSESRWSLFSQGSTFTAVGSNEVDSFTIDWPCDPEERSAIAKVLQDADQEIDALQRRLESVSSIKQGMMQELLTGRVRLPVGGQAR